MLQEEFIEPATTVWESPIVFAPKKDGTLRFCVDYRTLNNVTIHDSYPLRRMDECIDSMGEGRIFSTLAANSGYWQVEIDEKGRKNRLYKSPRLVPICSDTIWPQSAHATFQRAMNVILSSLKWQSALVYLDDIIVFSKTVRDRLTHLRLVLTVLQNAVVTLKLKMPLLRRDNHLPWLRHTTRKVENCGNNDKGDWQIARTYNTDEIAILPGPLCCLLKCLYKTFRGWRHRSIRNCVRTNQSPFLN